MSCGLLSWELDLNDQNCHPQKLFSCCPTLEVPQVPGEINF